MKDYEVVDHEIIETKKPVGRRRASAKQLDSLPTNYKSNEVKFKI